jgi:hypothetical protein
MMRGPADLRLAKARQWNKLSGDMLRDPCWVKARIGARILLRAESGTLTRRDIRLARRFGSDRAVEDRLLYQALASIRAEKRRRGLLPDHVPSV